MFGITGQEDRLTLDFKDDSLLKIGVTAQYLSNRIALKRSLGPSILFPYFTCPKLLFLCWCSNGTLQLQPKVSNLISTRNTNGVTFSACAL